MSPRVLFLPGAGGAPAFWQPVADLLPAAWEKELLAWPGLGNEPHDPRISGLDDLVDLVLERIGSNGAISSAAPVDLVTQSMGGVVAVQVALRRPELVRRLVLVATSGGIDLAPFAAEDWRPTYRQAFPNAATWIGEARVDVADRLPTLAAPALLLWSDADPISPLAVGERLASLLPNTRLLVVAGGDHSFARDRAAEVAPAILQHVASTETPHFAR